MLGRICLRRFAAQLLLPLIATHASLRLRVNLLLCSLNPDHAQAKKNASPPFRGLAYFFGSGGVICTVPTVPTRVSLK
jgi:hypothetical protein